MTQELLLDTPDHMSFEILNDAGEKVFTGVIWDKPLMIGVERENNYQLLVEPVSRTGVNLR